MCSTNHSRLPPASQSCVGRAVLSLAASAARPGHERRRHAVNRNRQRAANSRSSRACRAPRQAERDDRSAQQQVLGDEPDRAERGQRQHARARDSARVSEPARASGRPRQAPTARFADTGASNSQSGSVGCHGCHSVTRPSVRGVDDVGDASSNRRPVRRNARGHTCSGAHDGRACAAHPVVAATNAKNTTSSPSPTGDCRAG